MDEKNTDDIRKNILNDIIEKMEQVDSDFKYASGCKNEHLARAYSGRFLGLVDAVLIITKYL